MDFEKMAKEKLKYIIKREGDLNGERFKPYYLDILIQDLKQAYNINYIKKSES